MMRAIQRASFAAFATALCVGVGLAQEAPATDTIETSESAEPVDTVDHVAQPAAGGFRGPAGQDVRMVRPGALLMASFDRNFDGRVTRAEITAGSEGSFAFADRNSDGVLGGFEQSDWAKAIGGGNDILSNPMQFDANLDREITREEFVAGILRVAEPLLAAEGGVVTFDDLVRPIQAREERRQPTQPPPRPTP